MAIEGKALSGALSAEEAHELFTDELLASWRRACRRLSGAGYGTRVSDAYVMHSPTVARFASPRASIELADLVSSIAIRSGRSAATSISEVAVVAARTLGNEAFHDWMGIVGNAAHKLPESLPSLLERMEQLLGQLGLEALASWIRIGVRLAEGDPSKRLRYFSLEDPAAVRWLRHASGDVGFSDFEGRLRPFLTSLWGDHPPMRETPATAPAQLRRRSGFDAGVARLPASYQGFSAQDSERLYHAAAAHLAAHLRFTRERFPVGGLKPTQIALVSLIEDARIERLAMRELPGLARLFQPFHTIGPSSANTAPALFARLARALADPSYADDNAWVSKGRNAFMDCENEWHEQRISRRIGDLLGNDLGQMRIRFDAKTYVVQPPYRDDNLGLWDFGDDEFQSENAEEVMSNARVLQEEREDNPDRSELDTKPDDDDGRVQSVENSADGTLVARYPEFDYATGHEQPAWTSVREYKATLGPADRVAILRQERADLSNRLTWMIRSARVSRAEKLRRQPEGEFLDLDACIDAAVSRRMGVPPSSRIHGRYERRNRDLSVLLLLDVSQSTSDRVRDGGQTVLDVEKQAAALLSQAMSEVGDPFALAAFCSDRRDDVHYIRIKDFGQAYDSAADARLAGLTSSYSTRLGAAVRHAGAELGIQRAFRRLLLIVTDGEPSDIDIDDRRYLVEDARRAVQGLHKFGVDTFCVGLDSNADSHLGRIFGRKNAISIASVERLPELLPKLYLTLSH